MKLFVFKSISFIIFLTISLNVVSQQVYADNFAHTFSIVARDKNTGEMAVAVQSHWFSVGTIVVWAKSGVGVVATQSFVNPSLGPNGLKLMEEGKKATEALNILINEDEGRDFRQVAFLDVNGDISTYTGKKCVESAHHIIGDNFSVQANMMLNDEVVPAMAAAFEKYNDLPLADRVLKVLLAAQEAGGDIRGRQSAALLVVHPEKVQGEWLDKKVDLRVDDNPNPLIELQRLLQVQKAYEFMNQGDISIELGNMEKALVQYGEAEKLFPENLEMKYWKAVALANNGNFQESLPIFKEIYSKDINWKELTKRLPKSGLLLISDDDYQTLINL